MAVAAICKAFATLLLEVIVELGVQYPLRKRLLQIVEQTVFAKNLNRIAAGKQLVQQFLLDSHVMILSFPSSWPHAQNSRQSLTVPRYYVHFLRNALDYMPRKVDADCLMELGWFYDRRDLAEVMRDLPQWIAKWQAAP